MPVEPGLDLETRLVRLIRGALTSDAMVGVALSGGGDSVALLHVCLAAGLTVEAVTVDHGLRAESATEAAGVAAACAALGVRHEVRIWQHGVVTGNLMDQARRARLALIGGWARDRGINGVALGHTRDDQAETVLMGLARSAGIDGLAGMRRGWEAEGVRFCRPLLEAGREELREYLRGKGVAWIDDPTNEDDRFARVKARRALAALAPLGITAEGLATVAGNLAQAQAALAVQVAEAAARVLREEAGSVVIDRDALLALPGEVRRRLILAVVQWVSGADYPPRHASIERMDLLIKARLDGTLWGCRLLGGDSPRLLRERAAVSGEVAQIGEVWDARWVLEGPDAPGAVVRRLGAEGVRLCPDWRATGLPREVLEVTPALWAGENLLAAPVAGLGNGWNARIAAPFDLFGVSH